MSSRHAAECLRLLVERHQRNDGEARDAANRLDRGLELVEVVERLDHEEVGAASLEDRRLLGEQLRARLGAELDVAEWPDRARDEDGVPGHLARLACAAYTRGVDLLELVLGAARGELGPELKVRRRRSDIVVGSFASGTNGNGSAVSSSPAAAASRPSSASQRS